VAASISELNELRKQSEALDFWDSPDIAQKIMKKISMLQNDTNAWSLITHRISDAIELAQIDDEDLRPDIEEEVLAIEADVDHRELTSMLAGKYDRGDAILAIHAGAGGVDAQDWAEMLQRMYLRWAEYRGYGAVIRDGS